MIEPILSLSLVGPRRCFGVGEELVCEYQIDAVDPADIQAVEASVLWHTVGKGEEDLGVHFFERRLPADAEHGDLRPLRRLRTRLPNSPLSYRGAILSIEWCVRLRLFLRRGREYVVEQPFTLGRVPSLPPSVSADERQPSAEVNTLDHDGSRSPRGF